MRHYLARDRQAFNLAAVLLCLTVFATLATGEGTPQPLELSRPVRSWEFVSAVGMRAGLLGGEQGNLEAWVYPLKVLRRFHLVFHIDGAAIPAETLARTLVVRPESTTIVYASDTFSVRETLFVPVHEAGAVIAFQIDTREPLEIEALFNRDFELEWPGAIAGASQEWDSALHAFHFTEESGKYEALVGSPSATKNSEDSHDNYFSSETNSISLGTTKNGTESKYIVVAASFTGEAALAALYEHLSKDYARLLSDSAAYYQNYRARTIEVELPDAQLQSAYDWANVSMLQGLVQNPFLGTGLVAGYNASGDDHRPGFAWFFGRDAEWTALALNATGDFQTSRTALDFLSKYQRADGKIPHEVSQSAGLTDKNWFTDSKYAFASADATPLFIIAIDDYVTRSGDVSFAGEKWDQLWRAHEFLQSTRDARGLAQNAGVGHGWIEGGPLSHTKAELYQASLGLEADRALSHLAHLLGKGDTARELSSAYDKARPILDDAFWSGDKNIYSYALDESGKRTDVASVLATVPMWFKQLDADRADRMIRELAGPDQQADWGMRILSSRNPLYDPGGYHFGVVWPLFTGWASVGEYRYHQALPAYSNLRTNALLAFDGSLGHVTEVLSGKFYQTLSTGSPHQIWSAAMVVNPILSGLLGLETDATSCHLRFAPHVPAEWSRFSVDHINLGGRTISLNYQRQPDLIRLEVESVGAGKCSLEFSPSVSLRAQIAGVRLDNRPQMFRAEGNSQDQHVNIGISLVGGHNEIEIRLKDDFVVGFSSQLPALGAESHGLRVLEQSWSAKRDALTLLLSGSSGESYELCAWNPSQIVSVEGAEIEKPSNFDDQSLSKLRVEFPQSADGAERQKKVVVHLRGR